MNEIKSIDIVSLMERENVILQKSGAKFNACCPLPGHEETKPSFFVYPDSNSFHCFGCQIGGDAAKFIQKMHGLDFPGALNYLGIKGEKIEHAEIRRKKHEKKLMADFEGWCKKADTVLAQAVLELERMLDEAKAAKVYAECSKLILKKQMFQHYREVLDTGSDRDKYQVYTKLKPIAELYVPARWY